MWDSEDIKVNQALFYRKGKKKWNTISKQELKKNIFLDMSVFFY